MRGFVNGIGPGESNVSLLYIDPSTHFSENIDPFAVPTFFTVILTVTINVAVGYNCHSLPSMQVNRILLELVFDSAPTLYIGKTGPIRKGALHGELQELKINELPLSQKSSVRKVLCPYKTTVQSV